MPTGPSRRLAGVVLNYRTPDDTVSAVRSLLASTRPFDDIIVVDNDHGPGCRDLVPALGAPVRYLPAGRNLGFSGGMNLGIQSALSAGADAVLLVNSDATLTRECAGRLERRLGADIGIVGPLVRSGDDAIVSCGIDYAPASGRMWERRSPPGDNTAIRVPAVSGCVMLVAREVWDVIGLLEIDYFYSFEDIDLCLKARAAGFATVVSTDAVAYHRGSRTIGVNSPERLYFAARNHLLLASRISPDGGRLTRLFRTSSIVSLNVAHALKSKSGSPGERLRAVFRGTRDFFQGRLGEEGRPGERRRVVPRRADSLARGALEKLHFAVKNRRLPLSPAVWAGLIARHWGEVFDRPPIRQPRAFDAQGLDDEYRRSGLADREAIASRKRTTAQSLDFVALIDDAGNAEALIEATASLRARVSRLWLVRLGDYVTRMGIARDHAMSDSSIAVLSVASLIRPDGTWLPPGYADYVVLFDRNAVPASEVIDHLEPVLEGSAFDWIYTDDDRRRVGESPGDPYLKGAASPELALVDDYMTRLAVVRRRTIEEAGGLRLEAGDAQIYDLLLRILERSATVHHLPVIGCHRGDSIPAALGNHHRRAAERVILARHGASIQVSALPSPHGRELASVAWPSNVLDRLPVTIVIPTRDRVDLLARCIESIRSTVPHGVRVLVIDDHSCERSTDHYLLELERHPSKVFRVLRMTDDAVDFNYARLMNTASRQVTTPLMLHLNNDIEAMLPGWLQQMAGWLTIPEVGIVGAKLLDRQGAIDHAGVVVAPNQGVPEHMFMGLAADDAGYQWLPHRLRNVSAVTGACLLTRTDDFAKLGGFDEDHLGVQFNDVDFCLRIIASGRRIVYEPAAVLVHDVSASRGSRHDYRENAFFLTKHASYCDPFISLHLDPRSLATPTPRVLRSVRRAAGNA